MAMSPIIKEIIGSIAFLIFWLLAVFPSIPFLPIGRTAGSLLGAVLMVIFQIISSDEAYESIDLSILALLFGTMVVSVYLERADAFKYLSKLLTWKSKGGKDLICRICLISALTSAFFTNDTSCMFLTKFVLRIAKQNNLPPLPFLLALASSANIGSSATPIGNPQNLIIAVDSKISFGEFLTEMLPPALVGVCVNALVLICMFWNLLSVQKGQEEDSAAENFVEESSVLSYQFSPASISHLTSLTNLDSSIDHEIHGISNGALEGRNLSTVSGIKRALWKSCVYLVILGMLIALISGQNMAWTAITAALALMVFDFKDAGPCLDKVSYSLLVFFCGMFITVEGFDKTGIPSFFWDSLDGYAEITNALGVAVVSLVIIILSNLISNVATVLLLGGKMAAAAAMISPASEKKAWLILSWVSTVAGNLTIVGSAANLVVCEQAHRAPPRGYTLTFWNHLKFGLPSTVLVIAIGLALIK